MNWTERTIGAYLARETFGRRHLVVPNCQWTSHECDLLVVTRRLMICDVEIKISRADLRSDAGKQKWWQGYLQRYRQRIDWPPRVWRHYYCVPEAIWKGIELFDGLPQRSGVLLIREDKHGRPWLDVARRARSNPDAKPITAAEAIDIARLANLRMWDALAEIDRAAADRKLAA